MLRCKLCLLATAGMCASTLRAFGSIILQDIPDIGLHAPSPRPPFGTATAQLDIDGDGTDDFRFEYSWSTVGENPEADSVNSLNTLPGVVYRSQTGQFGADKLAEGFLIQPSLDQPPLGGRSWNDAGVLLTNQMNGFGWWGAGSGYLGIRIHAPNGARYGWIYMRAGNGIDIYSFAYETDVNTPVAAGAIPSPGTGLVLLAAMLGIRRRRSRSAR